jgi:hypothetical protein
MSERLIQSESWMKNRIKVTVYVPVPGVVDKSEAPAMGDSPLERDANIMKFAEEVLFPQYFTAVKAMIHAYEKSPLPRRCIIDQPIAIMPLGWNEYGKLGKDGSIIIDNDSSCGFKRGVPGALVYGAMIGYKIVAAKQPVDVLEKVKERIPMINRMYHTDDSWAEKFFSELTGELASGEKSNELFWLDEKDRKYFQREVLRIAWR